MIEKYKIYESAFYKIVGSSDEADTNMRNTIKKLVLYGIKMINSKTEYKYLDKDEMRFDLKLSEYITSFMALLTPVEMIDLFPIAKRYDKDKLEPINYFTTIEYLKTLEPDKPLGDKTTDFIWKYCNVEINKFNDNILNLMIKVRESNKSVTISQIADKIYADLNVRSYIFNN